MSYATSATQYAHEAEDAIDTANRLGADDPAHDSWMREAQVKATLAVAFATLAVHTSTS